MPAAPKTLFRSFRPCWLAGVVAIAAATALPANAKEEQERPVLQPWHTVVLKGEFQAGDAARIQPIADYQALETHLFGELDERVYGAVDPREQSRINRYWAGSDSDPRTSKPDWSRTMVMPLAHPRGLAEYLRDQGWYVVVLRLPGHGTAPSGLVEVKWQDWRAVSTPGRAAAEAVAPAAVFAGDRSVIARARGLDGKRGVQGAGVGQAGVGNHPA